MSFSSRKISYGAVPTVDDLESVDVVRGGHSGDAQHENEEESDFSLQSAEAVMRKHSQRWVTVAQVFFAAMLVTIGCIATTGYLVAPEGHYHPQSSQKQSFSSAPRTFSAYRTGGLLDGLYLKTSNEYGEIGSHYPWLARSENNLLFEPYKTMTVAIGGVSSEALEHLRFSWEFQSNDGQLLAKMETSGPAVKVQFAGTERKMLQLEVLDESSSTVMSKQYIVHTKYIKRELRSLTVEDREKFLDAAITLWKTSTEEGRAKYGPRYTSIDTFVLEHAIASNDIMCDQFHEGSGFYTHHMALQASFDAALKSVDPSVVLPYWDFTIEGQAIADAGEGPEYFMEVSPFLSGEWFGETDEVGHIVNSRWAHTLFPKTSGEGRVQPNSYGMIRSYWNNNNDPEVTRNLFNVAGQVVQNKKIPACSAHYAILNATTLGEFQLLSPSDGHGPMHVQTGGVVGGVTKDLAAFKERWKDVLFREYSDEELKKMGFGPASIAQLRSYDSQYPLNGLLDYKYVGEFFHIYRSLWRSHMCAADATPNLLECPESCAADQPVEECRCSVPKLESGETTWQNVYACIAFSASQQSYFSAAFSEEFLKDLTYMTARTSVVEGEMVEAASPADVLFWLIHPAINRLAHAKRLSTVQDMGDVPFHQWSEEDEEWLEYSFYTFGKSENAAFPDGNTCAGHAAADPVLPDALPLEAAFRLDRNRDGVVSNIEFYEGTNPNNAEDVDYIFDNFEWGHCNAEKIMG